MITIIAVSRSAFDNQDEMPILYELPPMDRFIFRPTLDWRIRVERRLDRDFKESANDNRSDLLNRIRPGVAWTYGPNWSGEVQYQLAHDEIWLPGRTFSDEATDLNLLYSKHKKGQTEVTIGRQKIELGSGRLLGSLEWGMTGRSFDGVRIKLDEWDAFAFKVGVAYPKPGRTRIAGVARTGSQGLTSLLFKHDDQQKPSTDVWTLSHLWQKNMGRWSVGSEAALQFGRTAGNDLRAWAVHFDASFAFDKATKGFVEVNAASGGGRHGKSYLFDNILPTNHKFYGSMDMQSWRNMEEIAFGLEHQVNPKLSTKAHFRNFALRDPSDGWYSAGGGLNAGFIDPTGMSGRDIGRELDLELTYKSGTRLTLTTGVAAFWPGSFIKARTGGVGTTQFWGFVAAQYRF